VKKGLYDQFWNLLSQHRLVDAVLNGVDGRYEKYRNDPVAFGEEVLGEQYSDEVKAMMRSVVEYPVTIAISATGPGKTFAGARIAVWFYLTQTLPKVFLAAAPPIDNLEDLLWHEVSSVVRSNRNLFKADYITHLRIASKPPLSSKGVDAVEDDGEIKLIKGLTIPSSGTAEDRVAKFSGKHAPSLLFIFDEGDAVPDEAYEGAEGCMSGGFVRMLILFNPKRESGEVYRMIKNREANVVRLTAFNHPNVITGDDVFPGAVTREETVRRINSWCRPLVENEKITNKCFKLPDFLVGTTARSKSGVLYPPLIPGYYEIRRPQFSYMVLGEYPVESEDSLISREWTAMARSRWDSYVSMYGNNPPAGVRGLQGQDVAEMGDDANCSCFRYGNFIADLKTWDGVDPMVTTDRAAMYAAQNNIDRVYVDATGVGAGVAPAMCRRGVTAIGVKVASRPTEKVEEGEFKILRDQLAWMVREWLRTDAAMLPPDEELLEELHVLTYETKDGYIRVMKKEDIREILKRSCNKFDALALTFATTDLIFPNL
jgi:hypothetical protein